MPGFLWDTVYIVIMLLLTAQALLINEYVMLCYVLLECFKFACGPLPVTRGT